MSTSKKKRRKKSRYSARILLPVIMAVVLLGVGLFLFRSKYARTGGQTVSLESRELDLRNSESLSLEELERCTQLKTLDLRGNPVSVEEYKQLQSKLPDCEIRWDIPLGSRVYDSATEELILDDLRMADWENLLLFPQLKKLHINAMDNQSALATLQEKGVELSYFVALDNRRINSATPSLSVQNSDMASLRAALPLLKELKTLRFENNSLSYQEQTELREQFPQIVFLWDVPVGNATCSGGASSLTLGTNQASPQELLEALPLFSVVENVDIRACNYSQEEINSLVSTFPEIHFLWQVEIFGKTVTSDDKELDLSGISMSDTAQVEAILPRLPRLEKVIMSDCGFSNEEMDALNKKYEDVRFVWTVYFGPFNLRTDATSFIAAKYKEWQMLGDRDCVCLKYCTDLEALDLGHMAISDLSFVTYMPHLKYLVVVESNIVDLTPLTACKELKYLEVFKCPIVDLSPLLEMQSIEDLNICYIWIPTQLAYDQLSQMTWLDRLWFCGTWFTEEQKQDLQKALPDCEMDLRWGAESTGGTWRKHEHYYEMRDAFDMYYMPGGTNGKNENGEWVVNPG